MTRNVTIKTWYVVSGTAGATVKSEDGTVTFCTIPEGGQGYFYATADKVVTSDDSVKITEATFNGAALVVGQPGGGGGACLVTKDANGNYLLGEGAQAGADVHLSLGLGPDASVEGNYAVAVGYAAKASGNASVAVGGSSKELGVTVGGGAKAQGTRHAILGVQAQGYDDGVAVGYLSHGNMQAVAVGRETYAIINSVAVGNKAQARGMNAMALGAEAQAGDNDSVAIGVGCVSNNARQLVLQVKNSNNGTALRFELLADDLRGTGNTGELSGTNAFVNGGAVRFSVQDKVSGLQENVTVSLVQLWKLLTDAGGVATLFGINEYY